METIFSSLMHVRLRSLYWKLILWPVVYTLYFLCQGTTRQKTCNLWSSSASDLGTAPSPMVSSMAAHASSSLTCGSATGWLRWWFSRCQASLCQYWTYAPLLRYAALFKGLSFWWDTRAIWWLITVVLDPMAVNFFRGRNINSWELARFQFGEIHSA